MSAGPQIGVMFLREYDPALVPAFARMVETGGLDDLWVVEDAFYNGGLSAAAVALASTQRITVGIGIQPAVAHNVAYNAMDLATLARIFPGRLEAGFGHGVADWMRQVGSFPISQMQSLETATIATRRLLRGESVSIETPDIFLDGVELVFPPQVVPRISLGVTGPKGLHMSGRSADGTILVELTGPAHMQECIKRIAAGQGEAGRTAEPHQITTFTYWSQSPDGDLTRNQYRPILAHRIATGDMRQLATADFAESARTMLDKGGESGLAANMPVEWINELAIVGTPDECARSIERWAGAGAHRICLVPPLGTPLDVLAKWTSDLNAARN
jgi:5,10-methylenetetrahydromethanopterin reductase